MFSRLKKQLNHKLNITFNGKKLYPTDSIKYNQILDKTRTWKHQINNVAIQIKKSNAMLSRIRYYVDIKTLKSIYHVVFEPHLFYASLVWAQNSWSVKK